MVTTIFPKKDRKPKQSKIKVFSVVIVLALCVLVPNIVNPER